MKGCAIGVEVSPKEEEFGIMSCRPGDVSPKDCGFGMMSHRLGGVSPKRNGLGERVTIIMMSCQPDEVSPKDCAFGVVFELTVMSCRMQMSRRRKSIAV